MSLIDLDAVNNKTYPRTNDNCAFDKKVLRDMGLPEDMLLTENQAYWLIVAWMED